MTLRRGKEANKKIRTNEKKPIKSLSFSYIYYTLPCVFIQFFFFFFLLLRATIQIPLSLTQIFKLISFVVVIINFDLPIIYLLFVWSHNV